MRNFLECLTLRRRRAGVTIPCHGARMAAAPGRGAGDAGLPPVLHRLRHLPAGLVDVDRGDRMGRARQRGERDRPGVRVRGERRIPGADVAVRRGHRRPAGPPPGDARRRRTPLRRAGIARGGAVRGRPPLWLFVLLAWFVGTGEAFFAPSQDALTVEIAPRNQLGNANALYGLARSATRIGGPALGGVLVALAGPAVVVAVDAASYAASVLALSLMTDARRHGRNGDGRGTADGDGRAPESVARHDRGLGGVQVQEVAVGGDRAVRLLQPHHLGPLDAAWSGPRARLPGRCRGLGRDHGHAGGGRDRGRTGLYRPQARAGRWWSRPSARSVTHCRTSRWRCTRPLPGWPRPPLPAARARRCSAPTSTRPCSSRSRRRCWPGSARSRSSPPTASA